MTEQKSGTPRRAPAAAGVTALVAAAVIAVMPHTTAAESERLVGYRDPGGVPTACIGHTGPDVKVGVRYTHEQCRAWFIADMTKAMKAAIAVTPALVENRAALMAAGDLVFNGGIGAYRGSTIAVRFGERQWVAGCNAFPGWWAAQTFSKLQPRYSCRPKKGVPGKWLCNLPGLETRRENEKAICLGFKA